MVSFLSVLLGLTLAVVVAVLITGVVTFAKGGAFNDRNATRLMNLRVATQGFALFLLALIWLAERVG